MALKLFSGSVEATNMALLRSSIALTALIFLQSCVVSQNRYDELLRERDRLQAQLDSNERAMADAQLAQFRSLSERLRSLIQAGRLRVKLIEGRLVVELPSDVLFESGSAQLNPAGRDAVQELARALAEVPERSFQIEGHTDNVPVRTLSFRSNWELGSARALAVLHLMIEAGMPAARISAASFGEHRPAASNESLEGRAANRRIEITVIPDLRLLPGYEELKRLEAESDGDAEEVKEN